MIRTPIPLSSSRTFPACVRTLVLLICSLPAAHGAAVAEATTTGAGFDWGAFIGPFHVVLLHFPIGLLAATLVLELLLLWRPAPPLRTASLVLLGSALLAGVVAAATGWTRADEGGFEPQTLDLHRGFALAMLGAIALALVANYLAGRTPDRPSHSWTFAYRLGLLLSLGLMTAAGHFGGSLTHGSDFLTRHAPPALAPWLGETATSTAVAPSAKAFVESPYGSRIQPLLESKCYGCHGPEKHKGDYRLDVKEIAFRGGESGLPGIVPGDPMKSNLLRLTLLPRSHDDAMPPEGKPGLNPEEVLALAHWIQTGAIWPEANKPAPTGASPGSTATTPPAP